MKLVYLIILTTILSCSSVQFDKKPPFVIKKATISNWVEKVEGVGGTNIYVYTDNMNDITLERIYYKKRSVPVEIEESNNKKPKIVGRFYNEDTQSDFIMHKDAQKEYGNQLPKKVLEEKNPFILSENEAVISYIYSGKKRYYKIEKLKKE